MQPIFIGVGLDSERVTFTLPIGADGWFVDQSPYSFEREAIVREWMSRFAQYADSFGVGCVDTFDPSGRYLCGGYGNDVAQSCNLYIPGEEKYEVGRCTIFGQSAISGNRGTCDWWKRFAGEIQPEPIACPNGAQKRDGVYIEDPTGEGVGCLRCPHGSKALEADPQGRELFCRFFGVHVEDKACCSFNGRNPVITFQDDKPVIPDYSVGLLA